MQRAAGVWPLDRDIREAPAHAVMIYDMPPTLAIAVLGQALKANPYSSDMLIALMKYSAMVNDQTRARSALTRLQSLLPPQVLDPELARLFVIQK